ncbi:MAG: aromatic amino acid lyase [Actinomycetota bacterium]|nr:aromatic amino acid lyase [Actinomycetota bacterium]
MAVVLTGSDLTPEGVARVARAGEDASLHPAAAQRMASARSVVERSLARDEEVYGLTTGVGAAKTRRVEAVDAAANARRLVRAHLVGQGPPFPTEVVRAATLVLVNGFAGGSAGVRPGLARHLLGALNEGRLPSVRSLGSVGQADLAPLADLAEGVLGSFELAPGEGLALLGSNAFATGAAALGVFDTENLLDAMDASAALSFEGFGANLGILHPAVGAARPFTGLRMSLGRLRELLRGSRLEEPGASRNLQDPLTFRDVAVVNGAARDSLEFARRELVIELNATQTSPMVVVEEDRLISAPNFDPAALASALDALRIGLAAAITSSSERVVKLLDASWSGLPRGLVEDAADGLSYMGIAAQAIAAEARLLAAPVSFELTSTAHAEGIEDRTSMAPLAARRVSEMVGLATRLVATELTVAAQAVDVRGAPPLGRGTGKIRELVRERIPGMTADDAVPPDPGPLVEEIRSGAFS